MGVALWWVQALLTLCMFVYVRMSALCHIMSVRMCVLLCGVALRLVQALLALCMFCMCVCMCALGHISAYTHMHSCFSPAFCCAGHIHTYIHTYMRLFNIHTCCTCPGACPSAHLLLLNTHTHTHTHTHTWRYITTLGTHKPAASVQNLALQEQ
jgi:hypothetical protein